MSVYKILILCVLATAVTCLLHHERAPGAPADVDFNGKRRMLALDAHLGAHYDEDVAFDAYEQYARDKALPNDVPALCIFTNSLNETGWYLLEVITNNVYNDTFQAYSAGYCEGQFTHEQINDAYYNYFNGVLGGRDLSQKATEFIEDQLYWMRQNVRFYAPDTPYWQVVGLLLSQLDGMYQGYADQQNATGGASQTISFLQFYYLTNWADQMDIIDAYGETPEFRESMCNFFIRVTQNDLFTAHSTFYKYYMMLRVYKVYEFNFNNAVVLNKRVSFSSRPGALSAADDYYTFGDFVVGETTLPNYNITNYRYLHSNSAPSWLRAMLANRLANNASSWVKRFQQFRSGTYNNQWWVVDYAQYRALANSTNSTWQNVVWMVEEFYYLYKARDMSQTLKRNGYIASYNMPINEEVYAWSGINLAISPLKGYTYDTVPRAGLFRSLYRQGSFTEGLQWLLYLNANLTGFPCGVPPQYALETEIAARCDLLHAEGGPVKLYGLNDGKFTNNDLLKAGASWIRCGPTTSGFEYPFNWTAWPNEPHAGMPQVFNFDWTLVSTA